MGERQRTDKEGARGPAGWPQICGTDDEEAETFRKREEIWQEVREIAFCAITYL